MSQVQERTLVSFDWAMKSILRDKANFDVLEGFLSTLLEQEITVISLLESESNQKYDSDKFNRVDLLVHDDQNRVFVVEVQHAREPHHLKRLLYGASKLVVENIDLGEPYEQVKKVVSISILYFAFSDNDENYLYHGWTEFHGLQNGAKLRWRRDEQSQAANRQPMKTRRVDPDNVFPEYYLIDVDQFKNSRVREDFDSKNMSTLRQKLDLLHMTQDERKAYENYVMNLVSLRGMFAVVKEEGREEGKAETTRALAHKLIQKGLPISDIADVTGLTEAEIAQIAAG